MPAESASDADQRWPREECRVADRGHDRHPRRRAGRIVGGGAHADREAERRADAPERRAGQRDRNRVAEHDEQEAHEGDRGGRAQDDDATEAVERTTAEEPPDGHRRDEDAEGDGSDRLRRAVAVHERDGDPVVRRPLREREGEDEQPDDERSPLAPGRRGARACAARRLVRRRDGDELPHGEEGDNGDERADGDQLRRERESRCRRDGAERGAGHRPEAERGVEPRHERASQAPLDVGSLDVHRDVPDTHAEAGYRKADRGRDDGAREEAPCQRHETEGDRERAAEHGTSRADPMHDRPGQREAGNGARGEAEEEQAEPRRRELEVVAERRRAAQERGEGDAVRREDGCDGGPRPKDGGVGRQSGAQPLSGGSSVSVANSSGETVSRNCRNSSMSTSPRFIRCA